jgi:hypothetical protein
MNAPDEPEAKKKRPRPRSERPERQSATPEPEWTYRTLFHAVMCEVTGQPPARIAEVLNWIEAHDPSHAPFDRPVSEALWRRLYREIKGNRGCVTLINSVGRELERRRRIARAEAELN